MEFRGQEVGYSTHHPDQHSSGGGGGGERRKDHTHNGNPQTLTLDHHHTHHRHLQQLQQLNLDHHQNQQQQGGVVVPVSGTGSVVSQVTAVVPSPMSSRSSSSSVRYRECLKNHAAGIGGNIVDGCGEFMPTGEEGTLEALTCAACNCHRNFHRKEIDGKTQFRRRSSSNAMIVHQLHLPAPPPPTLHHHHHHHQKFSAGTPLTAIAPPMAAAYGGSTGGGTDQSSSEELNVFHSNVSEMNISPHPMQFGSSSSSKKRFRTKFTQEQKDRMFEFAEKVGWRIQKQFEEEMEKLCVDLGVKRQVLKVWMHNNKNSMKRQQEVQEEQEEQQEQEQEEQQAL